MKQVITIYVPAQTNRLRYIFDLIFSEQLGLDYVLTSDVQAYTQCAGYKFSYSKEKIDDGLFLGAHPILFETNIKPQKVDKVEYKNCIGIFESAPESEFPFDMFASAFYLLSRYEEYLPHHVDQYKRFGASNSVAYHFRFLRQPMVNYYIELLKETLLNRMPELVFKVHKFEFIPTYDIDNAYKHKGRGLVRNILSAGKQLLTFKLGELTEKIKVLFFRQKDPFDTYAKLDRLHKKYNLYPIYFFLVNRGKNANDTNISYRKSLFKDLVKSTKEKYEMGIHPSFYSNSNVLELKRELSIINGYSGKNITKSRQHFLKVKFPDTYQNLIELGITEDYTMGYSSRPGFRTSYCHAHYWYDLSKDCTTNLRLFPFAFMDATFKYYKLYKSEKIRERLYDLYHETKRFGGVFICVFHNDILAEERFSKIYESFLMETN